MKTLKKEQFVNFMDGNFSRNRNMWLHGRCKMKAIKALCFVECGDAKTGNRQSFLCVKWFANGTSVDILEPIISTKGNDRCIWRHGMAMFWFVSFICAILSDMFLYVIFQKRYESKA